MSCSLQWKNVHYIFGGHYEKRQVSMVSGNRLDRKGSLDFEFENGGCAVLDQNTIVLCFGEPDNRELKRRDSCRSAKSPNGPFIKLPRSNFGHEGTRVAAFDGKKTIHKNLNKII